MICISIAQESRRFALVDMLNAASQCDLLEVRLDRFGKAPEIAELLQARPKPVILSCRRPQDGGEWDGTEEERLAILRQCIISKADYVEIELDVADEIRPFPGSKRVISYTNLHTTPADLAEIYAKAQTKKPDVIKLVTAARTPEEAWPLVQILAKQAVPTVAVGLGKPGAMLAVWGKKTDAPWVYAALERGMEAYPDQPTVRDLEEVYHYRSINRQTRLIGVTGFTERAYLTVALVNRAMQLLEANTRCLPMEVGNLRLFRKVLEAVKMPAAIVDEEYRGTLAEIATELQGAAKIAHAVDVIAQQGDHWHGFYFLDRAAVNTLEAVLRSRGGNADRPLEGRTVMLVGIDESTQALAERITKHDGIVVLASRDREAARRMSAELGCRFVPFEGVYTTWHDVLVLVSDEAEVALLTRQPVKEATIHPGYLKPGMTVMDMTSPLRKTPLLEEAAQRGCGVVEPRELLLEHVWQHVKLISGKEAAREPLREVMQSLVPEYEE